MFKPVSRISYLRCTEDKQVLVCVCDPARPLESFLPAWKDRAAALFHFDQVQDVFRDILANPQVRAVVLLGDSTGFRSAWATSPKGLPEEHLSVVRRFVDVYEEDCGIYGPLPPFWPKRLVYESDESRKEAAPTPDNSTR